jgi:hypothetical protein
MRFVLLVLVGFPLLGQVTVTAKPISISGAQGVLGSKRVGLWTVSLTSRYGVSVDVPHERITQSFPLLRDIPNRLAEDLLTRQSSNSFWSVVARWGPTLVAAGTTAYGTYDRIPQSLALATLLFVRAQQRAPEPSVYFSDFCPAHVALGPYGASTCYLASGVVKDAATMTALIDIP